jgi:hypothetical protein
MGDSQFALNHQLRRQSGTTSSQNEAATLVENDTLHNAEFSLHLTNGRDILSMLQVPSADKIAQINVREPNSVKQIDCDGKLPYSRLGAFCILLGVQKQAKRTPNITGG